MVRGGPHLVIEYTDGGTFAVSATDPATGARLINTYLGT